MMAADMHEGVDGNGHQRTMATGMDEGAAETCKGQSTWCRGTLGEYELWEVTGLVQTRIVRKIIRVSVECKSDDFHSKRLVF